MKYTINGKECTEFDINRRCAELMGVKWQVSSVDDSYIYNQYNFNLYNPCQNPADTWPIIEKAWDELMFLNSWTDLDTVWEYIIKTQKCSKLVAACILFIEIN